MNAGGRKIKITANQSGSEEFEPTMLGLVIFALNFTLGGHVRELEAPVKGFPSQLAVDYYRDVVDATRHVSHRLRITSFLPSVASGIFGASNCLTRAGHATEAGDADRT